MDGSISALYRGQRYTLAEFHSTPVTETSPTTATQTAEPLRTPWKPPANHPWKAPSYIRQQRIKQAMAACDSQNARDTSLPLAAP